MPEPNDRVDRRSRARPEPRWSHQDTSARERVATWTLSLDRVPVWRSRPCPDPGRLDRGTGL